MRTIVNSRSIAFFAGASAAAAAFVLGGAGGRVIIEPNGGAINEEPVLFWDVAGFGLGGPIHERFAVYTDGLVTYAYAGSIGDGAACFNYVPIDAVHQLAKDLKDAGVFFVKDEPFIALDVPITTVTAFQPFGNGQARASTFSFGLIEHPQTAQVAVVVQQFKDAYLPPGGCANGDPGQ